MAWCDRCDAVVAKRGWTRSIGLARLRTICRECYERVRERNWRQDVQAYESLTVVAAEYFLEMQDVMLRRFPMKDCDRKAWQPETGQLVLSREGRAEVVAQAQLVGTVSTASGAWMWSWANASILESVRADIRRVRQYGDEQSFLKLAAAHWSTSDRDSWEVTSISAYLLGAQGAIRLPDEHGATFFLFTGIGRPH